MNEKGTSGGSRMDKWLRIIWLVNGILLLIMFGSGLKDTIEGWIPRGGGEPSGPIVGKELEKAKADTLALQDIVSTVPERIGRTHYSYLSLAAKDLAKPSGMPKYSEKGYSEAVKYSRPSGASDEIIFNSYDEAINIIFLSDDGSDMRLLLREKGAVVSTDIPSSDDTAQSYNLYQIVFRDTNGDGRLTSEDRSILYISDLDGRNLRPLLPDSVDAKRVVRSFRDDEIFIMCQIRPRDPKVPESDWREIIYRYDVLAQKLSTILPDDRLMNEARRILQTE